MSDTVKRQLRIAFIHPDLGIGGAERLIVDAALGLQKLGHSVHIYTSHHDPDHCFDETRDGTLTVYAVCSSIPRSVKGKFHILLSHARQLHLTAHIIRAGPSYDVYFIDQLSTCIPLLRMLAHKRVVFYCHFPDKLLADGAYVEGGNNKRGGILKRIYRFPMDWLEELTTRQADLILANSKFTSRVFKTHFSSISAVPEVVYPGINLSAYEVASYDASDPDIKQIASNRPTLLSLNRFEKKKNTALAIQAFARLRKNIATTPHLTNMRLVIAGGYDPRLEDNMMTLVSLIDCAKANSLPYTILKPSSSPVTVPPFNTGTPQSPAVVFLLNFTTSQRSFLLSSTSTLALLYTPENEHFGIGPVEGMVCGLPVLACDSGGPTESIVDAPPEEKTGWLRKPDPDVWASALLEIVEMAPEERKALASRAKTRARDKFGMEAMAGGIEDALFRAVDMGPVQLSPWWSIMFALLAALLALYLALLL
ncbi:glycosyltransferase family 4 protein [Panus rudis PR-1116 ss-1]|nr:glycosyltransferase family 4 protein [Panus rudis PR-1116 ss-1]